MRQASHRRQDGERRERKARPLDPAQLQELALAYVARFATSRAKLIAYLHRKLRERGWADEAGSADPDGVADRVAELGFLDDAAYAEMKGASLTRRGYGRERVKLALRIGGIGEEDGRAALGQAAEQKLASALKFAQRKRIGPYAAAPLDPLARQKALAAMLRAGHAMDEARRVLAAGPGQFDGLEDCPDK